MLSVLSKPHPRDSWAEVLDSPLLEVGFLLNPYIPRGGVVLLHGRKSLGKSPVGWTMGLSIAAGVPWCGLPTTQCPVLYVETDTPRVAVIPRLKKLGATYPRAVPFYALWLGGINLTNLTEHAHDSLHDAHATVGPGLVIFNTTRRTGMGLDFNVGETPSAMYEAAREIFPGAALLFVHHDRKLQRDSTAETEKEDLSGNLAWANDAQVVIHLSRYGSDPQVVKLEHTGSQASALHPQMLLRIGADGSHVTSLTDERMEEARIALEALPKGIQTHEIDQAMARQLGISERTARRRRAELEKSGLAKIGKSDWPA